MTILDQSVEVEKWVLTLGFTSQPEQIEDAYQRTRAHGDIPYVVDRALGVCVSIPLSNRIEARYGNKVAIIGAGKIVSILD